MPIHPSKPRPKSNPFGSSIKSRSYSAGSGFRFGFNGKEKENNIIFNEYTFEFRIYNSGLGRFFSTDPEMIKYPWQTPYAYYMNAPISILDFLGLGSNQPIEPDDPMNSVPPNVTTVQNAIQNSTTVFLWSDSDIKKLKDFTTSYIKCTNSNNKQEPDWCCMDFFSKAMSDLYGGVYSIDGHMGDIADKLVELKKAEGPIKIKPTVVKEGKKVEAVVKYQVHFTESEKSSLKTNISPSLKSQLKDCPVGNYVFAVGPGQNIHCTIVVVTKQTSLKIQNGFHYTFTIYDDHQNLSKLEEKEFESKMSTSTKFAGDLYSEIDGIASKNIYLDAWIYSLIKP